MLTERKAVLFADSSVVKSCIIAWAEKRDICVDPMSWDGDLLNTSLSNPTDIILAEIDGGDDVDLNKIYDLSPTEKNPVVLISKLDAKTLATIKRVAEKRKLNVQFIERDELSSEALDAATEVRKSGHSHYSVADLKQALQANYLTNLYQPKVAVGSQSDSTEGPGPVHSVEALCRIQDPIRGMVSPAEFIALAESENLIKPLTDAVIDNAFRDAKKWLDKGLAINVAINMSPLLLGESDWISNMRERCRNNGLDPSTVTFEITESSDGARSVHSMEALSALRLHGFRLSIDDYGTGYSSMEQLYKLPFNELKIDQGFVGEYETSAEARTLIESTVALAKKLGMDVCAEGVETKTVFDELCALGCDYLQGYYIAKPLPSEEITPFFEDWHESDASRAAGAQKRKLIKSVEKQISDIREEIEGESDSTIVVSAGEIDAKLNEPDLLKVLADIESSLLRREYYIGVSLIEAAEKIITAKDDVGLCNQFQELKKSVEGILLYEGQIELTSEEGRVRFVPTTSATIGRPSSGEVDVPIRSPWMSRGEKNLRIFVQGQSWCVEDLGSTNGHFVQGQKLEPRDPYMLPPGSTDIFVGAADERNAIAVLNFSRSEGDDAVVFSVRASKGDTSRRRSIAFGQNDYSDIIWVFFHSNCALSHLQRRDENIGAVDEPIVCNLSNDGGLWLVPDSDIGVRVNGSLFCSRVPIMPSCVVTLGGTKWSVSGDVPVRTLGRPTSSLSHVA